MPYMAVKTLLINANTNMARMDIASAPSQLFLSVRVKLALKTQTHAINARTKPQLYAPGPMT